MTVDIVNIKMHLNKYCVYMQIIVHGYDRWRKLPKSTRYLLRVVKFILIKLEGGT